MTKYQAGFQGEALNSSSTSSRWSDLKSLQVSSVSIATGMIKGLLQFLEPSPPLKEHGLLTQYVANTSPKSSKHLNTNFLERKRNIPTPAVSTSTPIVCHGPKFVFCEECGWRLRLNQTENITGTCSSLVTKTSISVTVANQSLQSTTFLF